MAATKKSSKPRSVPESTWKALHGAYMATVPSLYSLTESPDLRDLARRFDVPLADARHRADKERWELEWEAAQSRAWFAEHGMGATSEEDFVERAARERHGHIMDKGPEGERLARAIWREVWRRAMAPLQQWDAYREHEDAEAAFNAWYRAHTRRTAA